MRNSPKTISSLSTMRLPQLLVQILRSPPPSAPHQDAQLSLLLQRDGSSRNAPRTKRTTAMPRWSKSSPTSSRANASQNFLWCTCTIISLVSECSIACSVDPDAEKVKMQLRDLEATFAAEEDGGTASVISKVNLWKVREQAALASGEKTVSRHLHNRLLRTAPRVFVTALNLFVRHSFKSGRQIQFSKRAALIGFSIFFFAELVMFLSY